MARRYRPSLERAPSALALIGIPAASVMLGSMAPILPMIATAPILPPLGLLMLLAWRLLVRELWPVWAGLPLGLFDDLLSGQPLGSSAFLWTLSFFIIDLFDRRMMWRDYKQDWLIGAGLLAATLFGGLLIANLTGGSTNPLYVIPQIVVTCLCLPFALRLCSSLDRLRWSL
ncbi:MAG: rod shape-determining protein MreD [Chakrabartia sp.]